MRQKLTEDLAINKCNELNLQFIRIEKGKKDSIIVFICPKHEKYGEQKTKWSSLKKATIGCSYCSGKKITTELFQERLSSNIKLISEYKGYDNSLKCKCAVCGNIWETSPATLQNGSGCPICGKEKQINSRRKSQKQFEKEVQIKNPHIKILGKYKNNKKNIEYECTKHNNILVAQPVHLLEDNYLGCPDCYKEYMNNLFSKGLEQFKLELKEVFPYFEVLGNYENCEVPIECKCLNHNKVFFSRPNDLLKGKNPCPKCAATSFRTENELYEILCKNFKNVERQKGFDDCVYKNKLKFDFYLPDKNILIEYDGEGHYRPIPFGKMSEDSVQQSYEQGKIRDEIKNQYCKKNNIPLIRVPYWEKNNLEQYVLNKINCLS